MLYPIVFIIGFLLSGIWFSFHIYVSQKLKNTKKALMFFALAYRNHTDDHYMAADG